MILQLNNVQVETFHLKLGQRTPSVRSGKVSSGQLRLARTFMLCALVLSMNCKDITRTSHCLLAVADHELVCFIYRQISVSMEKCEGKG